MCSGDCVQLGAWITTPWFAHSNEGPEARRANDTCYVQTRWSRAAAVALRDSVSSAANLPARDALVLWPGVQEVRLHHLKGPFWAKVWDSITGWHRGTELLFLVLYS